MAFVKRARLPQAEDSAPMRVSRTWGKAPSRFPHPKGAFMPEYYYTHTPNSEHEERHFTSVFMGKTLAFETDAGVFSKQHIDPGSEILCKSLPELHGRVLDMGCGWGAMTVMTLSRFPSLEVTMADVNERALDLAVRNVQKNGMQAKAVLSDGFANIEGEFEFYR